MKKVEFNTNFQPADDTFSFGKNVVMFTPSVGKDYWLFRVKLFKDQAIIGFPKFSTIGIGFAIEDADSNTNLPYSLFPEQIYSHIKANKKYDEITKEDCIQAIALVIRHCKAFDSKGKRKPLIKHNGVTG
ncbi:MAG: hypothetical protein NT040_05475 [Bacteroidetes bacterium]|nr:hypothetical protein [Bacteroidota bacterium]